MRVFYSPEVAALVEKLQLQDHARLERTRKFFEDYGFQIGSKYIKKITTTGVWELRAGRVRLFLCLQGSSAFGVYLIIKKTQKLPKRDIQLAEKRCRDL